MPIAVSTSTADRSSPGAIRRLAVAQAISFAGGTSAYVALTASIYARTGSATWVAAVAAVSFALPGLASPLAGSLGDRHDRRRVMVCSDLLGAACFVGLALLGPPAALLAVKALAALVAAPFAPVAAASVPRLAQPGELARANATVASWGTAGLLAGPLIGGAVTALGGASVALLLNAGTFVASAALIGGIRPDLGPADGGIGGRHPGITAGLRLLAGDRVLRPLTLSFGLLMLGMGTTLPAEIVRARELGVGAGGYGAMIAVWSAGGLVGARLAGRILEGLRAGALPMAAATGFALAYLAVAVAPRFALALACLAGGGLAEGLAEVVQLVVVQRRAPDAALSRVFAARSAIEQLGLSLPLIYAGTVVERAGAPTAFALAAGFCAMGAAVLAGASRPLPREAGRSRRSSIRRSAAT